MAKETTNQWLARFKAAPPVLQRAMMLTKKCRDRLELLRTLGIVERDLLPYMLILEETEMHEARLRSILTFEAACATADHAHYGEAKVLNTNRNLGQSPPGLAAL